MKKVLLLCLIALSALIVKADGVAGVEWGTEYEKVEAKLKSRYGEPKGLYIDAIEYENIVVGGLKFDFALFQFTSNYVKNLLSGCILSMKSSSRDDAEACAAQIAYTLSTKYEVKKDRIGLTSSDGATTFDYTGLKDGKVYFIIAITKRGEREYDAYVSWEIEVFDYSDDF